MSGDEHIGREPFVLSYPVSMLWPLLASPSPAGAAVADPNHGALSFYGFYPPLVTKDELGNRLSQTDANGHTTRFEYDKRGRQTARILPDNSRETMTYNEVGNLVAKTDFNGRTISYEYDGNNRLTTKVLPAVPGRAGETVTFTYSPTGRRLTAVDSRGTTAYAYDVRDRLTKITAPSGDTIDITYDPNGSRLTMTTTVGPEGARVVKTTTYKYDDASRLEHVIDPEERTIDFGYDDNGNRQALVYPNGTRTDYVYNDLNRLTNLTTTGPATPSQPDGIVQSYAFTLGAAGNRERIDEHGGVVRAYTYDDLYRLTGEAVTIGGAASYNKTFSYDPVGNRQTQTTTGTGAADIGYAYDERDRLTTEGTQAYTWDDNGNLASKAAEGTYTWDAENRLVKVEKVGTIVEHAYDADGNRTQTTTTKAGTTTTTSFLVDTSGGLSHVVAETNETRTLQAVYVRGGDDLLSVMRPDASAPSGWATRFYHADGIGSIRALTDDGGNVTDRYTYTAFGDLLSHTGTDPQPYAFAGEPYDPNAGFAYHRARWMDPRVGRFVGVDPWGGDRFEPATLHRYGYAAGDPVNRVDPTGRDFSLVGALAVGFAVTTLAAIAVAGPKAYHYANEGPGSEGGSTCSASTDMTICLQHVFALRVLGTSSAPPIPQTSAWVGPQEIRAVVVVPNSDFARRWHSTTTTRRGTIYCAGSRDDFWGSPETVLEEYYHVLEQWNTGRLSSGYAYLLASAAALHFDRDEHDDNIWEREAMNFAQLYESDLRKCLNMLSSLR